MSVFLYLYLYLYACVSEILSQKILQVSASVYCDIIERTFENVSFFFLHLHLYVWCIRVMRTASNTKNDLPKNISNIPIYIYIYVYLYTYLYIYIYIYIYVYIIEY